MHALIEPAAPWRWLILNGSGWNRHITPKLLIHMQDAQPAALPRPPAGYIVLVAPVDRTRPDGLRCGLARILPRIQDDEGLDDGPAGTPWPWAWDFFNIEAERIHGCRADIQNLDATGSFIRSMREAIAKLR